MSTFVKQADVRQEEFDWGTIGWRCIPGNTGARQIVVMPPARMGAATGPNAAPLFISLKSWACRRMFCLSASRVASQIISACPMSSSTAADCRTSAGR